MSGSISRRRVVGILAAVALASSVAAIPAGTASAGVAGSWDRVSLGPTLNFYTPGLQRLPSGALLAGWQENGAPASAQSAVIAGPTAGIVARGTITSGWGALGQSPSFASVDGQVLAAYAGALVDGGPLDGPVLGSRSSDGVTWTPDALPLSGDEAKATYGLAMVSDGHTPYTAFIPTSTDTIYYHAGYGTAFDALDNVPVLSAAPGGLVFDVGLARDPATGEIYSGWKVLGGPDNGYHVQRIWPTLGPNTAIPDALTDGNWINSIEKTVPIAASSAGGVYIAYPVGYPTSTEVKVRNIVTGATITVASGEEDVSSVDLSAGPNGSLWVSWIDSSGDDVIHAARSNSTVTKFGAPATVLAPGAKKGAIAYSVTGEGSTGPLDVVVGADVAGQANTVALFSSRIDPGLSVKLSKKTVSSGKKSRITVKVTDAGVAVKGATVRVLGKKYKTSKKGTVVITVPKGSKSGKKKVKVSASAYSTAVTTLTVRK